MNISSVNHLKRAARQLLFLLLAGCSLLPAPTPTLVPPSSHPLVANPASIYCEKNGGVPAVRTAADGSQTGVCILKDGYECEEFAFYRGECGPNIKRPPTAVPRVSESDAIDIAVHECSQGYLKQIAPPTASSAQLITLQHAQTLLNQDFTDGYRILNTSVWLVSLVGSWKVTGGPTIEPPTIGKTPHPTTTPGMVYLCRVVISSDTGESFGLVVRSNP
jgi:putative hemolysin